MLFFLVDGDGIPALPSCVAAVFALLSHCETMPRSPMVGLLQ